MRAISTAVDASVFLLLVSASALVLTMAPPGTDPAMNDTATATAGVVTTSTARVNYTLAPGVKHAEGTAVAFPLTDAPVLRRTAHGTIASLLADAAVTNLTVRGTVATREGDDFGRAVAATTRRTVARRDVGVQVIATWTPYPGAHISGKTVAGSRPPPEADVHAAVVTVPSGFPTVRNRAVAAARADGFDGLACVVGDAIVRGLFSTDGTRLVSGESYPASRLARYRYRRLASFYDADVNEALATGDVERANGLLASAMADAINEDLRRRYRSPVAAAKAVTVGRVDITVRTWSR